MSYKIITKEMYDCICERCDHNWITKKIPNSCSICKSTAWNNPKEREMSKTWVTIRLMDYGGFKIEDHQLHGVEISTEMLADRLEMLASSLKNKYILKVFEVGEDK